MENMTLYDAGRVVPEEAKKPIAAGRLKGFTDINPMWRIKKLTEMFGPCGIGWWYTIKDKRLEAGTEKEVRAFVDIELFYEYGGKASKGIPGTGGSSFVKAESSGLYVTDECFKMALTDAISVAAKALGIGADVYFEKDRTKYTEPAEEKKDDKNGNTSKNKNDEKPNGNQNEKPKAEQSEEPTVCEYCKSGKPIGKFHTKLVCRECYTRFTAPADANA